MAREKADDLIGQLQDQEEAIVELQSRIRGMLLCNTVGDDIEQLQQQEDMVCEMQALARAVVIRTQFAEKQRHYRQNMEKVIKIQSFVRGRQQGEAYKVLTSGKNPPVGTVKNFVHLLNDSDFDFDEEIGKLPFDMYLRPFGTD